MTGTRPWGPLIEPREQIEPTTDAAGPPARAVPPRAAVALVGALAVPFVVALVALRSPHWYANLDLALTELRVRDVTSGDPPLVGLSGRIEALGVSGSHPGPLSFWLLAPLYRLFGSSSWALEAATGALNLFATVVAVWIGHRRGGRTGALAVAAGMVVLLHAYGADLWTQAWNPYLPLMWWPVVLLAVWSVLDGDVAMLPVGVAAGSFCLQTHVSYLGLAGGMLGVAVLGLVAARARATSPPGGPVPLRWVGASLALLVVLWVPPLVEQVRHDPGNLTIIREQFAHPTEPSAGWGTGVETSLQRLDLVGLVAGRPDQVGSPGRGAVLLVVWAAAAVVTWRRLRPAGALGRLHLVVGTALVLGLVSISRIQGTVFDYLVLWSWGTAVAATAAVAWTAVELATSRRTGQGDDVTTGTPPARRAVPVIGLAAILVVALTATTWDAAHAQHPQPGQARLHADLLPEVVDALGAGTVPGTGPDGRYLVRSDDPVSQGLNSYTLLLELERQGVTAGVDEAYAVSARPFRVLAEADATAVVTYVVGPAIAGWRERPGAVEVAYAEPSPDDVAERDRLRDRAVAELERQGLDDLAGQVDDSALAVGVDPRVPPVTVAVLRQMIELSGPTAIFVSPPVGDPPR